MREEIEQEKSENETGDEREWVGNRDGNGGYENLKSTEKRTGSSIEIREKKLKTKLEWWWGWVRNKSERIKSET